MGKDIKKDDKSPNFLATKPKVKKNDKKATILIAAVIVAMGIIFILTLTNDNQKNEKIADVPKVDLNEEKPLIPKTGEGLGLAVIPVAEPIKDNNADSGEPRIMVVGPPEVDRDEENLRRERDEIRRRKMEARQQAITSSIMVRRGDDQGAAVAQAETPPKDATAANNPYAPIGPDSYDPAADRDKEAFFVRADQSQWVSPYTREAGRKYEIKTGAVIPGVMVSGINSDLPGNLIAQVSQNVFDSATGKFLLIPQGAKIYGVYDSRVVYGQERVLIAWNRVIFPDGSSITLGAMPGSDISGYAGFSDGVDNHYLRIFGSAILMSLITGATSYAMDNVDNNNNTNNDSTSVHDAMASALAAQIGQTSMKMLEKNMNIKPTLTISPGYQFNIVVTKDVVFRGAYYAH